MTNVVRDIDHARRIARQFDSEKGGNEVQAEAYARPGCTAPQFRSGVFKPLRSPDLCESPRCIGHLIETVQLLLGHVHLDHVAPYLEVSKKARCEAIADLNGVLPILDYHPRWGYKGESDFDR
nr:hypothetical protein [Burkholderia ambifaria]